MIQETIKRNMKDQFWKLLIVCLWKGTGGGGGGPTSEQDKMNGGINLQREIFKKN